MKILCLDLGNTNLNYGYIQGNTLLSHGAIPTTKLKDPDSYPHWPHDIDAIALSSVVPSLTETLLAHLPPTKNLFSLSTKNCPGFPIRFPLPHEIGSDRLATAIGAQTRHGTPVIVIDMGTATCFDVITKEGGYEGGIIAPGIALMSQYLHEKTALLPQLNLKDTDLSSLGGFGRSTLEAMQIGCLEGYQGMIQAISNRIVASFHKCHITEVKIIAKGGSALYVLKDEWKIRYDPHVTLYGLAEAYRRQHETCH